MFLEKRQLKRWDTMSLTNAAKVTICIIPKNKNSFLDDCLKSIFDNVKNLNYDIHIVTKYGKDLINKTNKQFIGKIQVHKEHKYDDYDEDFILFLDSDILLTYDAVAEMAKYACISNVGCVSHRLARYNSNVDAFLKHTPLLNLQNAGGITTSCLLIRKKLFDKIGKIDSEFGLKISELGYMNLCIRNKSLYFKNCKTIKTTKNLNDQDLKCGPNVFLSNKPLNDYSYVVCATNLGRLQRLHCSLKSKREFDFVYLNNNVFNMPSSESLNKLTEATTGQYIFYSHQDVISESDDFLSEFKKIIPPIHKFGIIGIAGMKPIAPDFYWLKDCKDKRTGADFSIEEYPFNLIEVQTLDEFLMIADRNNELRFGEYLDHFHFYGADICLTAKSKKLKNYAVKLSFKHCSNGSDNLKNGGYKHYIEQSQKFYAHWKEKFPRITTTTAIFEEKETYFTIGELYNYKPIKISVEPKLQKNRIYSDR